MQRRKFILACAGTALSSALPKSGLADTSCPIPSFTVDSNTVNTDCPEEIAPNWVAGLPLNTWSALPNTNVVSNVFASNIGQYGNQGPQSIFTAWCGGALATQQGTSGSMIHWGGGHKDYYGNEVYSFDLNSLTWSRLSEPSPHANGSNISNGVYPDNTPGSPHTYYFVGYRPATNTFFTTNRELNNLGGYTTSKISQFNLNSRSWTNSNASSGLNTIVGEGCVYDSNRDVVWLMEMQYGLNWSRYNFSSDSWTRYSPSGSDHAHTGSVFVPTKDCVLFFTGSGRVYALNPDSPGSEKAQLNTSGSSLAIGNQANMYVWSRNLGKVVAYQSRSNSIYTLTPPAGSPYSGTWTWERVSVSGSSGNHTGSPGTYGKFQVAEWGGSTVCLLNADVNGPCRAVRLA